MGFLRTGTGVSWRFLPKRPFLPDFPKTRNMAKRRIILCNKLQFFRYYKKGGKNIKNSLKLAVYLCALFICLLWRDSNTGFMEEIPFTIYYKTYAHPQTHKNDHKTPVKTSHKP